MGSLPLQDASVQSIAGGRRALRQHVVPKWAPSPPQHPPHARTASDQAAPCTPPCGPHPWRIGRHGQDSGYTSTSPISTCSPSQSSIHGKRLQATGKGKTFCLSLWMTSEHGGRCCPPLAVAQLSRVILVGVYCFISTPWMIFFGKSLTLSQPRELQNTSVCMDETFSLVFLQLQINPSSLA